MTTPVTDIINTKLTTDELALLSVDAVSDAVAESLKKYSQSNPQVLVQDLSVVVATESNAGYSQTPQFWADNFSRIKSIELNPDNIVLPPTEPPIIDEPQEATKYVAANSVSAYRVLAMSGGVAVHADKYDLNHAGSVFGISLQAGSNIAYASEGDIVENESWNLTLDAVYVLGVDGKITTSTELTQDGFLIQIGVAVSSTKLAINLTTPRIKRA